MKETKKSDRNQNTISISTNKDTKYLYDKMSKLLGKSKKSEILTKYLEKGGFR